MAWTVPITFTAGRTLTATMLNTYLRDNLSELAPAKATSEGSYFVATGANAIAEREPQTQTITTSQSTSSVTYTNLATTGPSVTCETGTRALVFHACQMQNSAADAGMAVSWSMSGSNVRASGDIWGIIADGLTANQAVRLAEVDLLTGINPGTTTFTMQYRVGSGTGTFANRTLIVMPL